MAVSGCGLQVAWQMAACALNCMDYHDAAHLEGISVHQEHPVQRFRSKHVTEAFDCLPFLASDVLDMLRSAQVSLPWKKAVRHTQRQGRSAHLWCLLGMISCEVQPRVREQSSVASSCTNGRQPSLECPGRAGGVDAKREARCEL